MEAPQVSRHQKGAEIDGATILFVDESGFYPLPFVTRTFAPKGQTPVLRAPCTRDHLSAISAVTEDGRLFFKVKDGAFNSDDMTVFLDHLQRHMQGKLVVIWDGAPIHRSKRIRAYLADGAAARVRLERLPGYAPELNPDEGVWSHLKCVELKNLVCHGLDELRDEMRKAVMRLRMKPRVIQGCFTHAGL